jgi:ketosteroid isomerase-like protein
VAKLILGDMEHVGPEMINNKLEHPIQNQLAMCGEPMTLYVVMHSGCGITLDTSPKKRRKYIYIYTKTKQNWLTILLESHFARIFTVFACFLEV